MVTAILDIEAQLQCFFGNLLSLLKDVNRGDGRDYLEPRGCVVELVLTSIGGVLLDLHQLSGNT